MTGETFATYVRYGTKTDTSSLNNDDLITLANIIKDDIATEIVGTVDENYFMITMVTSLIGDRAFTFKGDMLQKLNRVEVDLNNDGKPLTMTEADSSQFQDQSILDDASIKKAYAGKKPQFLIRGLQFNILSEQDIPTVTDGLKLVAEVYPSDITAETLASNSDLSIPVDNTSFGMPRQVHLYWAERVIMKYKNSRPKGTVRNPGLTQREIDALRATALAGLKPRNANRAFIATLPSDEDDQVDRFNPLNY